MDYMSSKLKTHAFSLRFALKGGKMIYDEKDFDKLDIMMRNVNNMLDEAEASERAGVTEITLELSAMKDILIGTKDILTTLEYSWKLTNSLSERSSQTTT